MIRIRRLPHIIGGSLARRASGLGLVVAFALILGFATSSEAADGTASTLPRKSASAPVGSLLAIPDLPPVGHIDTSSTTPRGVTVSGWALDPNTADPIAVHAYLDGGGRAFTANLPRPDIANAFGLGANHGFTLTMAAPVGTHTLCVYAINVPAGNNPSIGCIQFVVTDVAPIGHLDTAASSPNSITVSGWTLDPNAADPIAVHAYLDGGGRAFTANLPRPDIANAFGLGANHGYTLTMAAPAGTHTLCVDAINVPAERNPGIGCATVRNGIVEIAAQYVGVPYLWGGSTPAGFDCSGLTSYVYAQLGVHLPRTSADQHYAGTVVPREQAVPGDLIWSPGHVAIFAGGNLQIDAQPNRGVQFRSMYQANPVFVHVG